MMNNVFVVVPALAPEENLLSPLVDKLIKDFGHVVLVDDGSDESYRSVFDAQEKKGAIVLRHYINCGKGRAMKTAMHYILSSFKDVDAIVTADSDGQHSAEDITKVAQACMRYPHAYVLGCRDFDSDNVPQKSKMGNKITRNVFKIFVGLNITDTQTGLRGMSKEVATKLLSTAGERYEYETNTLIDCKEKDIPIEEVEIQTIYINGNETSHFNPIKDSWRIYRLFLKYMIVSVSSFVVDLAFFTLFLNVFNGNANAAFISTVCARILSSLYNFFINSKAVFKKQSQTSIIKYFILVVVQMFVSATVVNWLSKKFSAVVLLKVIVDCIIFVVNFIIQREWVFKNKGGENK